MCDKSCDNGHCMITDDLDAKVTTEEDVKIRTFEVEVRPLLVNPFWVVREDGTKIGSANISFTCRGFKVELFLDPATPERLDFEVDPNRLFVEPDLDFSTGIFVSGKVIVGPAFGCDGGL